jgi:hypothetical protein
MENWPGGWTYTGVTEEVALSPNSMQSQYTITLSLQIKRVVEPLIGRFFFPIILLTTTSWAGFFISATKAMPRVAVSFVSFLALQSFRKYGIDQLPKKGDLPYMTWLDVFTHVTSMMMWGAVLENMMSLCLCDQYSASVGRSLDLVARKLFPLTYFTLLIVLFIFAGANDKATGCTALFWGITAALFVILFGVAAYTYRCVQVFNIQTVQRIANILTSVSGNRKDLRLLDANEKVRLYDSFDTNHDGHITANEIADLLSKWASKPLPQPQHEELRTRIAETCGEVVPLDKFVANFMQIFGTSLSKPTRLSVVPAPYGFGAEADDDDDEEKQPIIQEESKPPAKATPVGRTDSKGRVVEL